MSLLIKFFLNLAGNIKSFFVYYWSKFQKYKKIETQKEHDKKIVAQLGGGKLPVWKQIKRLPKTLSVRESMLIKILSVFIIICAGYLFYTEYFQKLSIIPANGGEFAEGLIGSPLYINPLLAYNDADLDLTSLIYSGLLKYNDNLQLELDMAESYEISEDQKTYTFNLKKNIKWHDNKGLTAGDVVYTITLAQNPDYKSTLYRSFQGVTVEKIDEYSLKFTLNEPYAGFLNLLTVGIIPQHIWYDIPAVNAKLAVYNQKPIGSGPFKFKSLIKEKSGIIKAYTLEKNKDFYDKVPYLNKIIFKFYPDFDTATAALANKEVQNISYLPKDYIKKINKRDINIYNINLSQYTALFFNPKNNDLLKDKTVKEALAYAIDKYKIIEEPLQGFGQILDGPILPGSLGYNSAVKKYEYNPQKSLQILTDDGWQIEGETLIKKDNQLKITLTTVEQTENIKTANLIKDFWTSIGINVDLQLIPRDKIEEQTINPRNYQILLYGEIIGYDPDLLPLWHSSQREAPGLNLSNYANRNIDQLLEEARTINDPAVRSAKYKEFQDLLIEDLPAIFLYNPTYTYPVNKKIKGVNIKKVSLPADRFINIENWHTKTKRLYLK